MKELCHLCDKFAPQQLSNKGDVWDHILFESQNFIVVPTIGSIVEGWVLIVPKAHNLCVGALSIELVTELKELREFVGRILQDCYGPIAVFEHGPAKPKQAVGCGVDHAHLHMLPVSCDLIKDAHKVFPDQLNWKAASGIEVTRSFYLDELPYLYVEQPLGRSFIATHPNIPSQLFRKVVAMNVGHPERYNWRSYPEQNNVEATVKRLSTRFSSYNRDLGQPKAVTL